MNLIVHWFESKDADSLARAMAFLRSAWEDQNEARRRFAAGSRAFKLDPRKDVDSAKLFSPEEEKKLLVQRPGRRFCSDAGGAPVQASSSWSGSFRSSSRGRSRSKGKGKGKGKK
jgi:hypothetical protein